MRNFITLLLIAAWFVSNSQSRDSIRVYYKCENEMILSYLVPGLKVDDHTVKIKGSRYRAIDKGSMDRIAIIPDSAVVNVVFTKNGRVSRQVNLYSVQPPQPIIEWTIDGKQYDSFNKSINGSFPKSASVSSVIADEMFRKNNPKDAVYKIMKNELTLKRGSQTLKSIAIGEKILPQHLADLRSISRAGDVLRLTVVLIKRQNALGEWVDQNLSRPSLQLMIGK